MNILEALSKSKYIHIGGKDFNVDFVTLQSGGKSLKLNYNEIKRNILGLGVQKTKKYPALFKVKGKSRPFMPEQVFESGKDAYEFARKNNFEFCRLVNEIECLIVEEIEQ